MGDISQCTPARQKTIPKKLSNYRLMVQNKPCPQAHSLGANKKTQEEKHGRNIGVVDMPSALLLLYSIQKRPGQRGADSITQTLLKSL
jgi:hypothetical protein